MERLASADTGALRIVYSRVKLMGDPALVCPDLEGQRRRWISEPQSGLYDNTHDPQVWTSHITRRILRDRTPDRMVPRDDNPRDFCP